MSLIPQTTYGRYHSAAFAGQLGDVGPRRVEGFVNEETSAIAAGIAVTQGTNDFGAKLLVDGNSKFLGVVANTFARNPGDAGAQLSGTQAIMAGGHMNLVTSGSVWVVTEEALAPGDDVYMRHTAGTAPNTVIGAFRNDSDSSKCRQVKGARVLETSSAAGVALILFDSATANL